MKTYPSQNYRAASSFSAIILFVAAMSIWLQPFSALWAQSVIHNERILAPEVSHFVRPNAPGVDAHGDLSLSIPLMTVPGRDGLNFDIVAQYRSGIQVKQSASWIGLGWSLDVGSITRHPMAGLSYKHFSSTPQKAEQVDWDYIQTTQLRAQPDVYMVNMNGNSLRLLSPTAISVSPSLPYEPAQSLWTQNKLRLVPSPWKPWVISTANGVVTQDGFQSATSQQNPQNWVARSDISKIVITTEDGTRYVYSLPTLSEGYFPKETADPNIAEYVRYVSTWRLVAILSPNYAGPDTVDATSTGGWVKISYRSWKALPNYRKVDTIYNYPNLLAQITYPWKIETPTHYAEFTISKRYDRDLKVDIYNYNKKLDKISLYKKIINEGDNLQLIKEVFFHYKPNGAPDSLDSSNPAIKSMLSKLTLDSLKVKGYDASTNKTLPAYKFSYYDTNLSWPDVSPNPTTLMNYQDDFGYFWHNPSNLNDTPSDADGRMWSLKEITYPDGGRHFFEYENDVLSSTSLSYRKYDYHSPEIFSPIDSAFFTPTVNGYFVRSKQGGARVKHIIEYDGIKAAGDSVKFFYGSGYHTGIPEIWFRKSSELNVAAFYSAGDRGEFNVTYSSLEKQLADGSKIKTFYKTSNGSEPQMVYRRYNTASVILYGDSLWARGEVDSIRYFAAGSGNPVKVERFIWDFNVGVFAQVAPGLAHRGGTTTPPISSYFTQKKLDTLITKYYFGSNVVTSKEAYKYNDGALLEKKTETSGDGKVRTTKTTFIHDVAGLAVADSMKNRNMRSQIAQARVMQNDDSTKGFFSTVTTWKIVTHNGKNKFLPEKEYRWRNSATSATIPNFTWSNPDTTKWIRIQTFLGYDAHGNPTRIHDTYGSETTIYWGTAATLIDSIKTRPNSTLKPLTTKYSYDPATFRLTAVTDPNGQKTEYKYDPLQRLIEMITPDKRTAAQHSYLYSRQAPGSNDNFVTTNPNHVKTMASTHAEHVRNNDFENGAGPSWPDQWKGEVLGTTCSGCAYTWDTIGFSGAKSIKAYIPAPGTDSRVRWQSNPWYDEKVSSKKTYRMEVWTKTANGYNGNASFTLWFRDANNVYTERKDLIIPGGDRDWTKFTLDITLAANTDHLYAVYLDFISNGTYKGTIWYDRANFYELNVTKTFADGLGRDNETMQFEGNNRSTQAATYYDFADRVSKVTKPFLSADTNFTLTLSGTATIAIDSASQWYATKHPAYNSPNEYDISYPTNADAFSATDYWADPLNRVKYQYFPGTAFSKPSTDPNKKYIKNFYTTNQANELGFAANKVLETRTIDETDVLTEIFTDTFGNKVGVRIDSANAAPADSTKLATLFQYDILNNLTKIVPPKAFQTNGNTPSLTSPLCTNMTYNTLSQLTSRQTPDAGTDSMYYDKKGNLRFVKDAKGAAGNYFIYYKYDNLNRIIEEGTMSPVSGNFKQSNADLATYPSSGNIFKVKFQYDSTTYAASAPQRNLRGRLDAIEYVSDRFPNVKGYIFYSYDNNGNIEWIEQYIPKSNVSDGNSYLVAMTNYSYDAFGKVTKIYFHRTFPPGGASDAFYVWYDYDALGRLEMVYSNIVDVKPFPANNAVYTYWPGGQVSRLVLGNKLPSVGSSLQGVDYLYNSRDWLTQINSHYLLAGKDPGNDSTMVTKDRFGEIIGYNKQKYIASDAQFSSGPSGYASQYNGNISWITLNTLGNTNPVGYSATGWIFRYDKANRLGKANWGHFITTNNDWVGSLRYDVTGPTSPDSLIRYDRNGNLLAMIRRDQNGSTSNGNFTYNYTANTNKLHKVAGLNGQADNNYVYDANGNMIQDKVKLGPTNTITYDYRNLPTQVPISGNNIYFGYDGKGQRVSKNNLFYIPGADGRVIAVYDINGTHLYWNIWGLDLIGQRFWKQ